MRTIQVAVSRLETFFTQESRTGTRQGTQESFTYTVPVQQQRTVIDFETQVIPEPPAAPENAAWTGGLSPESDVPEVCGEALADGSPNEFCHALLTAVQTHGPEVAERVEALIEAIRADQPLVLDNRIPEEGDLMVWAPGAGEGTTGQAGPEGHIGVVEQVSMQGDRVTVTVQVSEYNWVPSDGQTEQGVPYRLIDLETDGDGLALPDGVGFFDPTGERAPQVGADGLPLPELGEAPVPPDITLRMNSVVSRPEAEIADGWTFTGCVKYIADLGFRDILTSLGRQLEGNVDARRIPIEDAVPREGSFLIWDTGRGNNATDAPTSRVGDDNVGSSIDPQGHIAFVEHVRENRNVDGELVSFTLVISEANRNGNGSGPEARAFTVAANEDGTAQMPEFVGFHHPALASVATDGWDDYTVQLGDTLIAIAEARGTTVDALMAGNDLSNADVIYEGQSLLVPPLSEP